MKISQKKQEVKKIRKSEVYLPSAAIEATRGRRLYVMLTFLPSHLLTFLFPVSYLLFPIFYLLSPLSYF